MISCILDGINHRVPQIILVYFNLLATHRKDDLILAERIGLIIERNPAAIYSSHPLVKSIVGFRAPDSPRNPTNSFLALGRYDRDHPFMAGFPPPPLLLPSSTSLRLPVDRG